MAIGLLDHGAALADVGTNQDTAVARDIAGVFARYGNGRSIALSTHEILPQLLDVHGDMAGQITANWYDQIDPKSPFRAKPYGDIPQEQISKVVDWAFNAPGAAPPQQRLTAAAQRMVRNASRNTVVRNAADEGVRYARLAQPNACAYCRALSIRGSGREDQRYLYHSEKSAVTKKSDGEAYHTHCGCVPIPIRGGQVWTPPGYVQDWLNQYSGASKATKRGPKYFQRIVAEMRAREPKPEKLDADKPADKPDTAAPAPAADAAKVAKPVAKPAAKVAKPAAKPTPAAAEPAPAETPAVSPQVNEAPAPNPEHKARRQALDEAATVPDISRAANELLPDTRVQISAEPILRQADTEGLDTWDRKAPAVADNAKAVVRAADDVTTRYPGLRLATVTDATDFAGDAPLATTSRAADGTGYRVTVNRAAIANPVTIHDAWRASTEAHYHYDGTDNPVYDAVVHEMGHVMRRTAEDAGVYVSDEDTTRALLAYFMVNVYGQAVEDTTKATAAYQEWLTANLSGSSIYDTAATGARVGAAGVAINGRDALADAFADVEVNGANASETSIVQHALLVDAYRRSQEASALPGAA